MTKVQKEVDEVRSWLRANAKQVKGFDLDITFNKGSITTHERKDLGSKGYKKIAHKFASFEELKKHYGKLSKKSSTKNASKGQKRMGGDAVSKAGVVKRMVRRAFKKGN